MSHSALDGEVKFYTPIDSLRSSSTSAFSKSSNSPLADCLSSDFTTNGHEFDMESLIPYFASHKLDYADTASFGCGTKSKMEALGLLDLSSSNSPLSSTNSNGIPSVSSIAELTRPFSSHKSNLLSDSTNFQGISTPSRIDYLPSSVQQKLSQKTQMECFQNGIPENFAVTEKRCMTVTERIQVPSSDHVAEIVGKNGQKIKQLREQLKVWVKTPSRDEIPVFEVTGLPEKIVEAKRLIQQMSDHFTKVQQERLARVEPNRVEDRLYVDQDKVGLIVGASGQTIRWVQHLSDTHIATPRKQESIPGLPPPQTYFTICGTRERVNFAKQLICEYVTLRCQGLWLDSDLESSPEASQLVRDFHQRRQAADTQRRTTSTAPTDASPVTVSNGLLMHSLALQQGRPLVSAEFTSQLNCIESDATTRPSLMDEMKSLWTEQQIGTQILPEVSNSEDNCVWNNVMFGSIGLGLSVDRRHSADTPSPSSHPSISAIATDAGQLKKSQSDKFMMPANGWM